MLSVVRGDFNAWICGFGALICLLLFHGLLCDFVATGDLRRNGTAGTENENTSNSGGDRPTGDPHSNHHSRDIKRYDLEMLFSFSGGGRNSQNSSEDVGGGERKDSEEQRGAMMDEKEGSNGGVLRRVYKDDGHVSSLTFPEAHVAASNVAINLPPHTVAWPSTNKTTAKRGEDNIQEMWNPSSLIENDNLGVTVRQDDLMKDNGEGPNSSASSPEDKIQTNTNKTQHSGTRHPIVNSSHSVTEVTKMTESKRTTQSEADTPTDSGGMIVFPDIPEVDDAEKSDDDSLVGTYFFIRAPLRNRTQAKCGPNQRFFRGKCRTYHP